MAGRDKDNPGNLIPSTLLSLSSLLFCSVLFCSVLSAVFHYSSVNIFRAGWEHAFHFDQSAFSTTLMLQRPDGGGGDFYHTSIVRDQRNIVVWKCARWNVGLTNLI